MSLVLKNVSFCYGSREILNSISFCIQPGELLFLLGKNGAGKSTLLSCMLGLNRGYEGGIFLDGKEVRNFSPKHLARRLAYIPQSRQPQFDYPVLDVVLMGLAPAIGIFSVPNSAQRRKAERILNDLGILHLRDRGYVSLSGGEKQLVMIARALMQQAELFLMDEPVSHLDYGNQQRVLKTAARLAREGYAVVITSHQPEHAFLYANRVLVLEDGKAAGLGSPEEILTEELLERIYGIPVRLLNCQTDRKRFRVCVPALM